jgi:hypothetical protein
MKITLIQGQFNKDEAIELITQLINVKIRFHEQKISNTMNEEDLKMRESKIKRLQNELYDTRKEFEKIEGSIDLKSEIELGANM